MEAALPPGSPSSEKADGKEYNPTGLKARSLKRADPAGQSVLEEERKEGVT